jgi:hypothetical protein
MIKRVLLLALSGLIYSVSVSTGADNNLCYNGGFNSTNGPLDGWNVNYEWMNNSNYMQNHEHVQVLPSFKGKKNVMWMNPPVQGRVESKLIPIEQGCRYKCTLDLYCEGGVRFYFNCYKWEPGIAPHAEPKLSEMRRIYKGEPFDRGGGSKWETISFYLPKAEISELAQEHYKYVRFATVYMTRYRGGFYVANVKVEKMPGTYRVVKAAPEAKTHAGATSTPRPSTVGKRQPVSKQKAVHKDNLEEDGGDSL